MNDISPIEHLFTVHDTDSERVVYTWVRKEVTFDFFA